MNHYKRLQACNRSDEEEKGLLWKLWRWLGVGFGVDLEVINHCFLFINLLFFFLPEIERICLVLIERSRTCKLVSLG
jgi:hypothetical protein